MPNTFEEAAKILRGLNERVEREKQSRTQSGAVNVFRSASDTSLGSDTVSVTTDTAASWTWDESEWNHDEWGE